MPFKLDDLDRATAFAAIRAELIGHHERASNEDLVTVYVSGAPVPFGVGQAVAPALREALIDKMRVTEAELIGMGVELEPAFPISSSSPVQVALGGHEGDETAPNATPERRVYRVLCDSDYATTVDHFFTKAEQMAKVAEYVGLFWERDCEDQPMPDDINEAYALLTEGGDSKLYSLRWDDFAIPG